jgi:hypothetical protein
MSMKLRWRRQISVGELAWLVAPRAFGLWRNQQTRLLRHRERGARLIETDVRRVRDSIRAFMVGLR